MITSTHRHSLVLIALVLAALLAGQDGAFAENKPHPLEPLDTSSPRATLGSFLAEVDQVWRVYRDQYWHAPSNLDIVQRFTAEGIEFAFPTSTTYLTQGDGKSIQLSIAGDTPLAPR